MIKLDYNNTSFHIKFVEKANKNIYLRIKEDYLLITGNKHTNIEDIKNIIATNYDSIIKNMQKIKQKSQDIEKYISYHGKKYEIEIIKSHFNEIIVDDKFKIYAKVVSLEYIKKLVNEFYKKDVADRITTNFNAVFQLFNNQIAWPIVSVKRLKSRYGQCQKMKKQIVISSSLAMHEDVILNYVLMHELVHMKYMNHQKEFYDYLEIICPNHKKYAKHLKKVIVYDFYY